MGPEISSEFPFESNFVDIKGSDLHYIDVGEGEPIVFLHGNPTWSYIWRNIIPYLQPDARCIAPDLIGMGQSDKPDISYEFEDHSEYIEAFIHELGLEDLTLVLHDWGSAIGFHYANTHRNNVAAIAFMEAIIRPITWEWLPKRFRVTFKLWRTPVVGWLMLSVANMFINQVIPRATVRELTDEELDHYREPYPSIASRKPVRVWPKEVPISGKPARVHDKVGAYSDWLTDTEIPKLCLYADPGSSIQEDDVEYIESNVTNISIVEIGNGLHYLQEDHPHRIGEEISSWFTSWERI